MDVFSRRFADEQYKLSSSLKRQDIDYLKRWISERPYLPEIPEILIIYSLHSCYYDMEATKKCIDNYFILRAKYSEFFDNRDPLAAEIQSQLKLCFGYLLPQRTEDNYIVALLKCMDRDPSKFSYAGLMKLIDMSLTYQILRAGLFDGIVILIDADGLSLRHLFKLNPLSAKRYLHYIQEALPVRLKTIHLYNVNYALDRLMTILKPFMYPSLRNKFFTHCNIESVYEYVPQEIFPEDVGGKAKSYQNLQESVKDAMRTNVEFFKFEETLKADLSKM